MSGLVETLEGQEDIIAAIPSVFSEDDKLQTGVAGYELTLGTAFNYFFSLSILFPLLFRGLYLHQKYFRLRQKVVPVDWVSGVCLVLRTSALQVVPGFPEDFFMYAEDLAFCRELRRQGRIIYFPMAQIHHFKDPASATGHKTMWLDSLFHYYRMQQKSGPATLKLFLLKSIFLKGFALRFFGYSLVALMSPSRKPHAKHMKLYFAHTWRCLFKA